MPPASRNNPLRRVLTVLSGLFSVTTLAGILALVNAVELDARSRRYRWRASRSTRRCSCRDSSRRAHFWRWRSRATSDGSETLYAADLIAASLACIAAIAALRLLSGPAVIVVVAGLAAAGTVCTAPTPKARWAGFGLLAIAAGLIWSSAAGGGQFLRLKTKGEMPFVERWNEHSYVRVFAEAGSRYIVIDRGAATAMRQPSGTPQTGSLLERRRAACGIPRGTVVRARRHHRSRWRQGPASSHLPRRETRGRLRNQPDDDRFPAARLPGLQCGGHAPGGPPHPR